MDVENCTPEQWLENESSYKDQILNDSLWNRIPLLNVNELHNLKDARLVRFFGMVQDMHGPEYYLEKYEVINENTQEYYLKQGKYHDIVDCNSNETINFESPRTIKNERHSYVAISIPALNPWVKSLYEEKNKLKASPTPSTSSTIQTKRPIDDEEEEMETHESSENSESSKRQCTEQSATVPPQTPGVSREFLLNFPIPDASGKACHLKSYDNLSFTLNTVGEFVGFLSVSPILSSANGDEEVMEDEEFQTHNPPPSLIPRVHCVAFKELKHTNPLIQTDKAVDSQKFEFLRKELLILFTQLLLGDELAAEYLIYNLISEVYLRKDYMAIGKFSLNISNVPMFESVDFVTEFYKFIENLVEKSHYTAMTLENMNELTFVPKKDYKSNRLTSSILQLSQNTHFVLDETKLSAGKLNVEGVNGVKAIANAIKNQKNIYDFTYYQIDFDCDIPFLVFSEGKSMLPSDSHVILKPDELHLTTFPEILDAANHFLKPELLNDIRVYLTCARMVQYELSDNVQELVQNEFVNMRQKGSVNADDLHSLLVLARLVCISQGKTTLDEDCWRRACVLEEARKDRIKQTTS